MAKEGLQHHKSAMTSPSERDIRALRRAARATQVGGQSATGQETRTGGIGQVEAQREEPSSVNYYSGYYPTELDALLAQNRQRMERAQVAGQSATGQETRTEREGSQERDAIDEYFDFHENQSARRE